MLTRGRAEIGHHAHIALEEDKGSIELDPRESFRLIFKPSQDAPHWSELKIALIGEGWLTCRRFHVKFLASSNRPAHVQVALRLYSGEGFRDCFADARNEVDIAPQYLGADISIPPRSMAQAHACDLHLFFDNTENTIDLHDLVVTGLA